MLKAGNRVIGNGDWVVMDLPKRVMQIKQIEEKKTILILSDHNFFLLSIGLA